MLAATIAVVLSFSQLIIFGCIIAFAAFLAFCIGVNEGRAREAAEPSQRLGEDDARGIGCRHG